MSVELAVMVPVVIVVGLTVYNLMRFVEVCAVFDHVALDAVVSQGVAPEGEQDQINAVDSVRSCIEDALDSNRCSVEVEAQQLSPSVTDAQGLTFPVSPLLTKFECTLSWHPWPGSFVIAGVVYDSPIALTHSRSIVVDRFRPGVVV